MHVAKKFLNFMKPSPSSESSRQSGPFKETSLVQKPGSPRRKDLEKPSCRGQLADFAECAACRLENGEEEDSSTSAGKSRHGRRRTLNTSPQHHLT